MDVDTNRADNARRRVVIVHDYLTQRGGAERVVLTIASVFPAAPIVTSLYEQAMTYPDFRNTVVLPSVLQMSSFLRSDHRRGLPLYAPLFSATAIEADLVICSTSGWAHGVHTPGRRLLYVHNTARWLYQGDDYVRPLAGPLRAGASLLAGPLRRWDRRRGASADVVLVNSRAVQARVRRHWGVDAEVLYPPHTMDPAQAQTPLEGIEPGYLLVVARLLPYKRVDVIVSAMRERAQHRLVVVGTGPELEALRANAPRNCIFVGSVPDEALRWLYANCLGLVSAASEDLGLAPLEAMAFGKPVAVLRAGGFVETVVESVTGVFFAQALPRQVAEAVDVLSRSAWDHAKIAGHAATFDAAHFGSRLGALADELLA